MNLPMRCTISQKITANAWAVRGSQFTNFAFPTTLEDAGIPISMDGRGRCMDNVFTERLWRRVKIRMRPSSAPWRPAANPQRHRFLDSLQQWATPAFNLCPQDTRRELCYGGNDGEIGDVASNQIHLSQAGSRRYSNPRRQITSCFEGSWDPGHDGAVRGRSAIPPSQLTFRYRRTGPPYRGTGRRARSAKASRQACRPYGTMHGSHRPVRAPASRFPTSAGRGRTRW